MKRILIIVQRTSAPRNSSEESRLLDLGWKHLENEPPTLHNKVGSAHDETDDLHVGPNSRRENATAVSVLSAAEIDVPVDKVSTKWRQVAQTRPDPRSASVKRTMQ